MSGKVLIQVELCCSVSPMMDALTVCGKRKYVSRLKYMLFRVAALLLAGPKCLEKHRIYNSSSGPKSYV